MRRLRRSVPPEGLEGLGEQGERRLRAPTLAANEGKKPLRLGLIIGIGNDPDGAMAKIHGLGLPTCQAHVGQITPDLDGRLRVALDKYQIEGTSVVVGGPGREMWDFYQGR